MHPSKFTGFVGCLLSFCTVDFMAGREENSGADRYKLTFTMDEQRLNCEQAEVHLEQLHERVDALILEKDLLTDELNKLYEENIKLKNEIVLAKCELCKIVGAENVEFYLQKMADEGDN